MKRQLLAATVVAAALVIGTPMAASAVTYPSSIIPATATAGATISYTSAVTGQPAGASASASVTGDRAATEASITLASTLTRTFQVASDGRIKLKIALPTTAAAGSTYTLVVSSGPFVETRAIAVVGAPADAAGGLAFTGTDPAPMLWFGAGLLALGGAFVGLMIMRRRNRASALQQR